MRKNKSYTIGAILEEGRECLKNAGIESFDIDSRVLLSYLLGIPHHEFFSNHRAEIPQKLCREYKKLVRRREKSEPVAQIIGEREFWALPFKVSRDTLIPRPDSETIIEAVKSEFKDLGKSYHILDMGTGSGCLLLSLLSEYKNATGIGFDIKSRAVKVAKENAKKLSLDSRGKFVIFNWYKKNLSKKISNQKYDIVVSNPPYITQNEMKTLSDDVKNYEPKTALYGGKDGLDEYRQVAKALYYWDIMGNGGRLFFELGRGQHADVKKIFEAFGFKFVKYFDDINGIIRVIEFMKK